MNYVELLKKADLKATPQRLSVLKTLDKHKHPTIDELFEEVKETYPSISLATVYKNLNVLIDNKLAIEIQAPNQKSKYDVFETPHVHVVCKNCGHVEDIMADDAKLLEYKDYLQNYILEPIDHISVTVCTKNCKFCAN